MSSLGRVGRTSEPDDGCLNHVLDHIAEEGSTVTHVVGDSTHCSYSYTIGLTALRHPELVVTGLRPDDGEALLGATAHDVVHHGLRLTPGRARDGDLEVYLLPITRTRRRLWTAVDLYGPVLSGLQIVWQDDDDRFPWESAGGCSVQPLLGRVPRRHELAGPVQPLAATAL